MLNTQGEWGILWLKKVAIFEDLWSVDYINQTVVNGARALSITGVPTVTTYSLAMEQLLMIVSCSFEIKIVSKYLLSDTTEHNEWLTAKVPETVLIALQAYSGYTGKKTFEYQSDIDLFIFDHMHNDAPTALFDDVTTRDITTPCGAFNTFIDLINLYRPRTVVAIVSDYSNYTNSVKVLECQKQLSDYWHIPYLDVCSRLPFGYEPVTTQGYWDTYLTYTSHGSFHDKGFTFEYEGGDDTDWKTNDTAISVFHAGKTASQIISLFNIREINGILVHDLPQRQIWFKDNLHPSTDHSYTAITKYAQVLCSFLNTIGNV